MNEYIKNRTLLSALITSLGNNLPLSKQEEKDIRRYLEDYQKALNEIERLNNIINETEKWLESEIKRLNDIRKGKGSKIKPYGEEYNHYSAMISGYRYCLDKIKELKGSDK